MCEGIALGLGNFTKRMIFSHVKQSHQIGNIALQSNLMIIVINYLGYEIVPKLLNMIRQLFNTCISNFALV